MEMETPPQAELTDAEKKIVSDWAQELKASMGPALNSLAEDFAINMMNMAKAVRKSTLIELADKFRLLDQDSAIRVDTVVKLIEKAADEATFDNS